MTESKPSDSRIDGIIAEYLKAVAAGSSPDRGALLAQHADVADELRSFFADDDRMHRFVEPATIGGESAAAAPLGKVRYFGDYELLEEIARGGMGVVYKARQVSLNRVVALKMILAGQLAAADDVRRFRTEAEAAANLDHPNILPIYEVGEYEGQHYFSMKLVNNGSLTHRLDMAVKAFVEILTKVARAMHFAHQKGILHRDLKPANVLLDDDGTPYVTDFGLAKHIEGDRHLTQSGAIVGTPSYMAPEQARSDKQLTTGVDVYALGAMLYEALAGRPPFKAATPVETILQVLHKEPALPRKFNAKVDRDLETISLRCLEKDPLKRYLSAAALADELERWQRGEPIVARPSGPAKRALKWVKRNPTLTCLFVVLALWYFDVRLTWRWVWFEWALYGLVLFDAARRLIIVCAKAIGRCADKQLDLFNDGIFLPATVIAVTVLSLYPGDLADRKSLAVAIVFISIFWGSIAKWLWRKRQAGPLSLAIHTRQQVLVVVGMLFGILTVSEISSWFMVFSEAGDRLVNVCSHIQSLSGTVFLFLSLCGSMDIRKLGIVTFFRFVRWNEIEFYDWKLYRNQLFVRIQPHKKGLTLQKGIDPSKKDMVGTVLSSFVPYKPQDDSTIPENQPTVDSSAPAQQVCDSAVDSSAPAQQVRDPAAGLVLSGIFDVSIGLVFFMGLGSALLVNLNLEKTWNMSRSAGLVALIISAAVAATGIAVIIGAWKMRKLRNYHFCRVAAILAMLPLGPGVLFGLPCGIWALRRLNKPAVRAAFAKNDAPPQERASGSALEPSPGVNVQDP